MTPRPKELANQIREKRKTQILAAAYQVFSQKGLHLTTIADVASAADVSYGMVHHYFGSKDELFVMVFEQWMASYTSQWFESEELLRAESAAEQLKVVASAAAQMMIDSAEFLPVQLGFWSRMVHSDALRERFRQLFAKLRSSLAAIIQTGVDSGEFRRVDPEPLAAIALATFDGLILQWFADNTAVDWRNLTSTVVDSTLAYLKAGGE